MLCTHSDFIGLSINVDGRYAVQKNIFNIFNFNSDGNKLSRAEGIYLSYSHNNKFIQNTITSPFSIPNYYSNAITNTNSNNNIYCCNTTNNTTNGLYFEQTSPNQLLKYNQIQNHEELGLSICSGTAITPQIDNWNTWMGTYGMAAAKNGNPSGSPALGQSRFEVSKSKGTIWFPNDVIPTSGWFSPKTTAPEQTCQTTNQCSFEPVPLLGNTSTDIPELATAYATGLFQYGNYGAYHQWEGSRWVLRSIEQNPSWLGQNPIIDAFHAENEDSNIKKLNEIDQYFAQFYTPNAQQQVELETLKFSDDDAVSRIKAIDALLSNNDNSAIDAKLSERTG